MAGTGTDRYRKRVSQKEIQTILQYSHIFKHKVLRVLRETTTNKETSTEAEQYIYKTIGNRGKEAEIDIHRHQETDTEAAAHTQREKAQ